MSQKINNELTWDRSPQEVLSTHHSSIAPTVSSWRKRGMIINLFAADYVPYLSVTCWMTLATADDSRAPYVPAINR